MKLHSLVFGLVGLSWSVAPATAEPSSEPPLAVVISERVDIESMSKAQLRQVFLGESVNAGGKRLIPLNLSPKADERQTFDQKVLGMKPNEVPTFWVNRRIRGEGHPPKTIPSAETLLRLVAKLPGAIGYVPLALVGEGVRIVRIDGKAPSDPGYEL